MDYLTLATLGTAIEFGDSTWAGGYKAGASSPTRGTWSGGRTPGNRQNLIDFSQTIIFLKLMTIEKCLFFA